MSLKISALLAGAYLVTAKDQSEAVPAFAQYMKDIEAAMNGLKGMTNDEVAHTQAENEAALTEKAKQNAEALHGKLTNHQVACDGNKKQELDTIEEAHQKNKAQKQTQWAEHEASELATQKAGFESDLSDNASTNAMTKKTSVEQAINQCSAHITQLRSINQSKYEADTASLTNTKESQHDSREATHVANLATEKSRLEGEIAAALEGLRQKHHDTTTDITGKFKSDFAQIDVDLTAKFENDLNAAMNNLDDDSAAQLREAERQFQADIAELEQTMADLMAKELAAQEQSMNTAAAAKFSAMETQMQNDMSQQQQELQAETNADLASLRAVMKANLEGKIARQNADFASQSKTMTDNFRAERQEAQTNYNTAKGAIVQEMAEGYNGIVSSVQNQAGAATEQLMDGTSNIPEEIEEVFGAGQQSLISKIKGEASSIVNKINEWVASSPSKVPEA